MAQKPVAVPLLVVIKLDSWAKKHFNDLNEELEKTKIKQRYFFHFLSPNSYAEFIEYFCDNRIFDKKFRSNLEDLLELENGKNF